MKKIRHRDKLYKRFKRVEQLKERKRRIKVFGKAWVLLCEKKR
jgi:hypothetical protein